VKKDLTLMAETMFNSESVTSRFENTGVISFNDAFNIGMVGLPARASGLKRDVRQLNRFLSLN